MTTRTGTPFNWREFRPSKIMDMDPVRKQKPTHGGVRRKVTAPVRESICDWIKAQIYTTSEIAAEFNVSPAIVRYLRLKHNLPIHRPLSDQSRAVLNELYDGPKTRAQLRERLPTFVGQQLCGAFARLVQHGYAQRIEKRHELLAYSITMKGVTYIDTWNKRRT